MKVIINRGIPGSGKSTGARRLKEQDPDGTVICSSDDYPGLYDEQGNFHPELLSKSHPNCMSKFIWALNGNGFNTVIVDNTNVSAVEIAPYLLVAQSYGAEVEIHQYDAGSIDEAHSRNTHRVPLETCIRMFEALRQPLPSWWPRPKIIATHRQ